MKIFNSKKDPANTANPADATNPNNNVHDPMDAFSLESLDLNALDNDLLANQQTQPVVGQTTPVAHDNFDFEVFDLDGLDTQSVPQPTSPHASIPAPTPVTSMPSNAAAMHNASPQMPNQVSADDIFGTAAATAAIGAAAQQHANNNPAHGMATTPDYAGQPPMAAQNLPPNAGYGNGMDNAVPPPAKNAKKARLFSKRGGGKPTGQPVLVKTGGKKVDSKKLLLLLLPLALLGLGYWWFTTQMNQEEPAPVTTPVVKPKTAASKVASTAAAVSNQVASGVASGVTVAGETAASAVAATASAVSNTATTAVNVVKPDEILQAPLPTDEAIAKEELDRLAAQSDQLKAQEEMIEKQIQMVNELSAKKEERIKLLEQQVAQLEQQKAAQKSTKTTP